MKNKKKTEKNVNSCKIEDTVCNNIVHELNFKKYGRFPTEKKKVDILILAQST